MKKALLVSGVLCASIAQSAFAESSNKRIMVISDPHLIADGVITESHGTGNCGVISETIFDRAVEMVKNAKPDLLLIPGDLTYTGEASSHSLMAEKLSSLKKAGIQTLVIPGNHDIRNIYSLDDGNANISSDEFKKLYADYGYNTTDGTLFDAASLSWAKSVSDDLAVIGLDGCIYSDEDANTNIGMYAFIGCKKLEVVIDNSIDNIKFYDWYGKEVSMEKSYAFYNVKLVTWLK